MGRLKQDDWFRGELQDGGPKQAELAATGLLDKQIGQCAARPATARQFLQLQ
jgi:hypothetical protein